MYKLQFQKTAISAADSAWLGDIAFSTTDIFDERRSVAERLLDSIYRDFEAEAQLSQFENESEITQSEASVFPNPAHHGFNLSINNESAQIMVFDISGKLIYQIYQIDNLAEYDASSWSEGFYTIHINASDGKHYHLKWIKQ